MHFRLFGFFAKASDRKLNLTWSWFLFHFTRLERCDPLLVKTLWTGRKINNIITYYQIFYSSQPLSQTDIGLELLCFLPRLNKWINRYRICFIAIKKRRLLTFFSFTACLKQWKRKTRRLLCSANAVFVLFCLGALATGSFYSRLTVAYIVSYCRPAQESIPKLPLLIFSPRHHRPSAPQQHLQPVVPPLLLWY